MFRDTNFVPQKSINPQKKRFRAQETCTELCGTVDVWIRKSFHILPRAEKGEYFAKGTEKCKTLLNLLNKEVENMSSRSWC